MNEADQKDGKAGRSVDDSDISGEHFRERERRETIAAVRQGIADMKAGRTRPAEEVFRDVFERFGIPETE
jgi:predicted transcriptional regulator